MWAQLVRSVFPTEFAGLPPWISRRRLDHRLALSPSYPRPGPCAPVSMGARCPRMRDPRVVFHLSRWSALLNRNQNSRRVLACARGTERWAQCPPPLGIKPLPCYLAPTYSSRHHPWRTSTHFPHRVRTVPPPPSIVAVVASQPPLCGSERSAGLVDRVHGPNRALRPAVRQNFSPVLHPGRLDAWAESSLHQTKVKIPPSDSP
jgi:hypothetical protein